MGSGEVKACRRSGGERSWNGGHSTLEAKGPNHTGIGQGQGGKDCVAGSAGEVATHCETRVVCFRRIHSGRRCAQR